MSTREAEARIVSDLSVVTLGRLRANAVKKAWNDNGDETRRASLLRFVELARGELNEIEELARALPESHIPEDFHAETRVRAKIRSECGDLNAYAAMLFDLAGPDSPDFGPDPFDS